MSSLREKILPKGSFRLRLAKKLGSIKNPVKAIGAAAVGAVAGFNDEKDKPIFEPPSKETQAQQEVQSQTSVNKQMGFWSDESGNPTTQMTEDEFRQEFGDDTPLPESFGRAPATNQAAQEDEVGLIDKIKNLLSNDPVVYEKTEVPPEPKEVQIITEKEVAAQKIEVPEFVPEEYKPVIGEAVKEVDFDPKKLSAQLISEGLTSSTTQLQEAYKREQALGAGQHRPGFIKDHAPKFEAKYGREYNPENLEDNVRLTALVMKEFEDRFGSWEAALIAYNKGPSVVQQYIDDPNVTFEDDPYVQGVKEKLGL